MTRAAQRALALAALMLAGVAGLAATAVPAAAHPLGNFSVNTYSALVVAPTAVRVDVVVDRAEIPTRQVFPELDAGSGALPGGTAALAAQQCASTARQASLELDGRPVPLVVGQSSLTFPPGAAGLRTARLVCSLGTEDLGRLTGAQVAFSLTPPPGAAGWNETIAVGDGTRLMGSDVPQDSVSNALRAYPDDLLSSPLNVRSASFEVRAGSGTAAGIASMLETGPLSAVPRGADRVTELFTGLVARDSLGAGFIALALGVAVVLGGAHAFAPGHGKTLMAAYLLGRRGSLGDALVIGASVTATHTLGVVALGLGLTAAGLASPERLYPWLALFSGLLLGGIGVVLLRSARRHPRPQHSGRVVRRELAAAGAHVYGAGPGTREHVHPVRPDSHAHDHAHPDEPHSHGLLTHTHRLPSQATGLRGLVAVGFAGGLVPSPSALVVLIGGIALGRAWFGLLLVLMYGIGMAIALTLTGLALARGRDRLIGWLARASSSRRTTTALRAAALLPVATAVVVIVVGAGVATRAASQLV